MPPEDDILDQQIRYYRERAVEYDQWFLRQGRYDRGAGHRAEWFGEIRQVEEALRDAAPRGQVLELACGTGLWTAHLARTAERVTAVDAAPEAIRLNRERLHAPHVEYVEADIFSWRPPRRFDFAFFGFWLSHVPEERFDPFWRLVADALAPGGRAFFVDSLFTQDSTARDHAPIGRAGRVERRLDDGRRFEIVKVFHEPEPLRARLAGIGWKGYVRPTGRFFLFGCLSRDPG